MTKLTMEQKVDKILEFFKFDSDKWPCKVDKSLDDLENKLEIEHVVCLKRNGDHSPSNIVPACSRCNRAKYKSLLEVWYPKQKFFTKERYQKIKDHLATAQIPPVQLDLVDIFKQSIYGVA